MGDECDFGRVAVGLGDGSYVVGTNWAGVDMLGVAEALPEGGDPDRGRRIFDPLAAGARSEAAGNVADRHRLCRTAREWTARQTRYSMSAVAPDVVVGFDGTPRRAARLRAPCWL